MSYVKKISSIEDIYKQGFVIIDENKKEIKNNILKILNEKHLSISDLSKLTGISRQNISAIIKGKVIPGIDMVLKISYVLNTPIEEIFKLEENAWIAPATLESDNFLYLDKVNIQIVDNKFRKNFIKNTGFEYYNIDEQKYLSKKEKEKIFKNAKKEGLNIEELEKKIIKIFYKLGKKITPIVIK